MKGTKNSVKVPPATVQKRLPFEIKENIECPASCGPIDKNSCVTDQNTLHSFRGIDCAIELYHKNINAPIIKIIYHGCLTKNGPLR